MPTFRVSAFSWHLLARPLYASTFPFPIGGMLMERVGARDSETEDHSRSEHVIEEHVELVVDRGDTAGRTYRDAAPAQPPAAGEDHVQTIYGIVRVISKTEWTVFGHRIRPMVYQHLYARRATLAGHGSGARFRLL